MAVAQPRQTNLAPLYGNIMESLAQRANLELKRTDPRKRTKAAIGGLAGRAIGAVATKGLNTYLDRIGKTTLTENDYNKFLEANPSIKGTAADTMLKGSIGTRFDDKERRVFLDNISQKIEEIESGQKVKALFKKWHEEGKINKETFMQSQLPGGAEAIAKEGFETSTDLEGLLVSEYLSGKIDKNELLDSLKKKGEEKDQDFEDAVELIKISGLGLGQEPNKILNAANALSSMMKAMRTGGKEKMVGVQRVARALFKAQEALDKGKMTYDEAIKQMEANIKDPELLKEVKKRLKKYAK